MDLQAQQQQLAAAVSAAVSPTSTQRAEAYTFLEQVRQSRLEVWPACLGLFLSGGEDETTGRWKWTYEQQARVFGLTILDEVLLQCFDLLSAENVEAIRQGVLDYARREYVTGEAEQNSAYAKNKVARTIFCLFLNTYATTWQSFFADFAALVRAQPAAEASSSSTALNPKATDLFLRILHEIALEISDVQLRLNKDYGRLNKDTELRDLIRVNAASGLSALIFEVLRDTLAVVSQPAAGVDSAAGRTDLVEYAVRAIGDYVSWIDINLVITPHTIPLIFQCLQAPQLNICTAAVEACHETIAKGMPSGDKLEVIKVLNIREVCRGLLDAAVTRDTEDPDEIAFRLRLARLLNTTGMELSKAAADAGLDQERKRDSYAGAAELLAMALRFLQDPDLGICGSVQPFITANLQDLKKQKKVSRMPFADDQIRFLTELLDIVVRRMEFPEDADWNGVADDSGSDDNAPFLELRQSLRILFDAVAFIDDQLFTNQVKPFVAGVLDAVAAGGNPSLRWQKVELVLHILWLWGEADKARGVGVPALVEVSKEELDKAKRNREYKIDFTSLPPSPLGDLLKRTFTSHIAAFPHPSIPLQYFECIVRYHDLFTLIPESIPYVLTTFCGPQGLHHPDSTVQQRCCYLFSRFVSTSKEQLQQHVSLDMTKSILAAISDLLELKVELSDTSSEDPLTKAAHSPSAFDSQLFLFESVGTLICQLHQVPQEQSSLLQAVVDRLITEVRSNVRTSVTSVADLTAILRLHHAIIAVGSICRGFPVLTQQKTVALGDWPRVFVAAMSDILQALTVMSAIAIVREATISSFKVVVNGTGTAVLPLVPTLIETVLDKLKANEVIDFLPFIGLLMHKYKSEFIPLLDAIVHNVFARVYHYLSKPASGTDDKLQHSELRRAFYSLITNIVNANHQDVFLSDRNKPHLESFMKSLVFHSTGEATISDKRAAFGAINRLVNVWVASLASTNGAAANGDGSHTVPGFEQFIYEHVVPICIDSPTSKAFDYSDGQSFLLLGEMTTLMKSLYTRRGQEFVAYLDGFLKAMGYPADEAQALLNAVATASDWHDLKKFYAPFCQEMRKVRFEAISSAPGTSAFATSAA